MQGTGDQDAKRFLTADEWTERYLRGRDVPCPECGYNRRDGTSVRCPECGCEQRLTPSDSDATQDQFIHNCIASSYCIVFGLVGIAYTAFYARQIHLRLTYPYEIRTKFAIVAVVYTIGFSLLAWRSAVWLQASIKAGYRPRAHEPPARVGHGMNGCLLYMLLPLGLLIAHGGLLALLAMCA